MNGLENRLNSPISSSVGGELKDNHFESKMNNLICKIWQAAAIATAIVAGGALMATVAGVGTVLAPIVLAVSFTALSLLLAYRALELVIPHLSGIALKAAEIALTFFKETAALVAVVARYPFSLARQEDKELDALIAQGTVLEVEKSPILLIHGFLDNSSSWYWHKKRLEEAGFGPIYTVDLGSRFLGSPLNSIESDYVEAVREKAEKIATVHGTKKLILVGHSMGGVVASQYATTVAEAGDVTDVFTLGSPLKGTKLANLASFLTRGMSKCTGEMSIGSEFLKTLQEKVRDCTGTRFHHLTSGTDPIIIPNSSAAFDATPEGECVRHYRQMGHLQYLLSGRVSDDLCHLLRSPHSHSHS